MVVTGPVSLLYAALRSMQAASSTLWQGARPLGHAARSAATLVRTSSLAATGSGASMADMGQQVGCQQPLSGLSFAITIAITTAITIVITIARLQLQNQMQYISLCVRHDESMMRPPFAMDLQRVRGTEEFHASGSADMRPHSVPAVVSKAHFIVTATQYIQRQYSILTAAQYSHSWKRH